MRLLGFEENDLAIVLQALREPSGLILNTGPTGCGKTTTMYSMLRNLDGMATKIVTIEDPVEYRMENATQIPVNNAIGMGFAPLLRSVLRHDPDTILVGEIRDAETAHTAAQAGLTGHLLLSTLHTTDAPEVLLRLMEMGVEHFYIRAVVKLIVAQRLARKPCPQCRVSYKASADELSEMGLPADQSVDIFRAVGCPACSSGYRDRTGIFQVMPMTPKIEELMVPGVQLDAIRREALDDGMRTLWQNGVKKVLEGQTTLEEIRRVLPR
jgi:type II secretory ATPase GspE/PulE/Tfp pilus assembly ATPase PilB-like protein